LVLRAGVHVENLLIEGSASDGVWAEDFGVESAGLSVRGAEGAAVVLTSSRAATHFPRGGTFGDNGEDAVRLRFSEMGTETSFPDVGVPYVQEADVAAPEGTLTFEAGVDYRFAPGVGLSLGAAVGKEIEVFVNGTDSKPVIFRGVEQTPGSWKGIEVIDNVMPGSAFSHVEIRDGGKDFYVLYFRSPVALDHVLLDGNNGGMFVAGQGLAPGSSDLTIRNTAGSPLTVRPGALVTLPEGGDLRGNELDHVSLEGGDFTGSGVVPNPGIPFHVLGVVRTLGNSSMTLSPGSRFIMGGNGNFEFGADGGEATIVAAGNQDAPIRFTGAMERAGYWAGLSTGLGVGAGSKFEWIEVGHAKTGCLNLRAPVPVTHSSFFDCEGYGIRKNIDDTSNYTSTNSFRNVGTGDVGNLPL
jgi:hypothetical protein